MAVADKLKDAVEKLRNPLGEVEVQGTAPTEDDRRQITIPTFRGPAVGGRTHTITTEAR